MRVKKYTVVVLLTATPDWLRLSRLERGAFFDQTINPIFGKYAPKIKLRWLDAEAFSARCSDVAIFEVADLQDHYFLMEELRDTALFAKPYFRMEEVIIGLEDGFQVFEAAQAH